MDSPTDAGMPIHKGLPAEVCEECKEVYLPPASLHLLDAYSLS